MRPSVLVYFWAEWCKECQPLMKTVQTVSAELGARIKIVLLNVDENPAVTARFGVRSIPTLLVFKGGQIVDKQVGAVPKSVLSQKLQNQVA